MGALSHIPRISPATIATAGYRIIIDGENGGYPTASLSAVKNGRSASARIHQKRSECRPPGDDMYPCLQRTWASVSLLHSLRWKHYIFVVLTGCIGSPQSFTLHHDSLSTGCAILSRLRAYLVHADITIHSIRQPSKQFTVQQFNHDR